MHTVVRHPLLQHRLAILRATKTAPKLFRELVRKFGWQVETREQLLDRFVSSRPATPAISEKEIMDEVKAVRYAK